MSDLNLSLPKLAQCIINDKLMKAAEVKSALDKAQGMNIPFTAHLVNESLITSEALLDCAAKYSGLSIGEIEKIDLKLLRNNVFKAKLLNQYRIIPLWQDKNILYIGLSDPFNEKAVKAMEFHTGKHIFPVLIPEKQLAKYLQDYFSEDTLHAHIETTLKKNSSIKKFFPIEQEEISPVIEIVDRLIKDALAKNASDIHIEPQANNMRIRFRCNGILREITDVPKVLGLQITARIKIMAQMNIAECRLPQDGRITLNNCGNFDIRASTCPTLFGEKIVLRLLNTSKAILQLKNIGLDKKQQDEVYKQLHAPCGLILAAGPTGSGKTSTLYAALNYLNIQDKNLVTIEDPIEIQLPGVTQININPAIGFNFADALRAFLRQDPDIIMVGEIRDAQTAHIAVQAAQTGHLVLATLHANNAIQAIERLQAMGIETNQLINNLNLVIAQRLIRLVCPTCSSHEKNRSTRKDCLSKNCQGRIGIFECLIKNIHDSQLKFPYVLVNNMNLLDAGLAKIKQGLTNLCELKRIIDVSTALPSLENAF